MATPELETLAWGLAGERCRTFSWWAAYYGLTEYYARLTCPTRDQLDVYLSWLGRLRDEIESLPEASAELDAINRDVLTLAVDYERFWLGHPPYEAWNISPAYLLLDGVHEILQLSRLSEDEKLVFLLARLEQGQALFDTLRQTWELPTVLNLEDTISQAQQVDQVLTTMLTPLMDHFPQERPTLEKLIAATGEKSRRFAHWLQDEVEPGTHATCYVLGKEGYEQLLSVRQEGHTWSERLEWGERSLQASRRRLDELAPDLAPEDGTLEAALEKARDNLPEIPILEEARNAYQRVAVFLKDRQLLHVPDARCEIAEPPSWDPFWGEGMIGITYMEILRDDPQFTIIVVPPTTEKGRRELNRSDILLAMAHEGAAGHLGSCLLQKNRETPVRLLLRPGTGIDDRWTFYWEQVLREEGIEPTLDYEFLQEYRVFWCSLRHVCDVKLHCGLMSFEECADFLATEGHVSPLTARAYTKAIAQMPGYFSSFVVGKEQLIRLREHVKAILGTRYSPAAFHQWVGEAGPIPHSLLEREIFERAGVTARIA
jgi:hypothetical protein